MISYQYEGRWTEHFPIYIVLKCFLASLHKARIKNQNSVCLTNQSASLVYLYDFWWFWMILGVLKLCFAPSFGLLGPLIASALLIFNSKFWNFTPKVTFSYYYLPYFPNSIFANSHDFWWFLVSYICGFGPTFGHSVSLYTLWTSGRCIFN